jgi:hypothetical protein
VLAAAPPPPTAVYADRAGDSGTAPDVTKVKVTETKAGRLDFVVVFKTPYGSGSNLDVLIGAHRYRLEPYGLEIWDPPADDYEPTGDNGTAFSVAPGGRALETSVTMADLGRPKSFRFTVESVDGDGGTGHVDTVSGVWPKPTPKTVKTKG